MRSSPGGPCRATWARSQSTSLTSCSAWGASSASRSRAANCSPSRSSTATRSSCRTLSDRRGPHRVAGAHPFADLSGFEKNPDVGHLGDLFTVELIPRYFEGKFGQGEGPSFCPLSGIAPGRCAGSNCSEPHEDRGSAVKSQSGAERVVSRHRFVVLFGILVVFYVLTPVLHHLRDSLHAAVPSVVEGILLLALLLGTIVSVSKSRAWIVSSLLLGLPAAAFWLVGVVVNSDGIAITHYLLLIAFLGYA